GAIMNSISVAVFGKPQAKISASPVVVRMLNFCMLWFAESRFGGLGAMWAMGQDLVSRSLGGDFVGGLNREVGRGAPGRSEIPLQLACKSAPIDQAPCRESIASRGLPSTFIAAA